MKKALNTISLFCISTLFCLAKADGPGSRDADSTLITSSNDSFDMVSIGIGVLIGLVVGYLVGSKMSKK
jgi:hypothetical protein